MRSAIPPGLVAFAAVAVARRTSLGFLPITLPPNLAVGSWTTNPIRTVVTINSNTIDVLAAEEQDVPHVLEKLRELCAGPLASVYPEICDHFEASSAGEQEVTLWPSASLTTVPTTTEIRVIPAPPSASPWPEPSGTSTSPQETASILDFGAQPSAALEQTLTWTTLAPLGTVTMAELDTTKTFELAVNEAKKITSTINAPGTPILSSAPLSDNFSPKEALHASSLHQDEPAPSESLLGNALPSAGASDEAFPGDAVPTAAFPSGVLPSGLLPGEASFSSAPIGDALPTGASPSDTFSGHGAPSDGSLSEALPSGLVPSEGLPDELVPVQPASVSNEPLPSYTLPTQPQSSQNLPLPSRPIPIEPVPSPPSPSNSEQSLPSSADRDDPPAAIVPQASPMPTTLETRIKEGSASLTDDSSAFDEVAVDCPFNDDEGGLPAPCTVVTVWHTVHDHKTIAKFIPSVRTVMMISHMVPAISAAHTSPNMFRGPFSSEARSKPNAAFGSVAPTTTTPFFYPSPALPLQLTIPVYSAPPARQWPTAMIRSARRSTVFLKPLNTLKCTQTVAILDVHNDYHATTVYPGTVTTTSYTMCYCPVLETVYIGEPGIYIYPKNTVTATEPATQKVIECVNRQKPTGVSVA